jgi:hypothetical protein
MKQYAEIPNAHTNKLYWHYCRQPSILYLLFLGLSMHFQIYGERCSGTNYLEALLRENFGSDKITWKYGWKHWYVSLDDPRFSETEEVIFILIARNFYDWARSFFYQPHHLASTFPTYQSFLTNPITSTFKSGQEQEHDANIFMLRKNKMLNWMALREKVKHFHFIRYEDLVKDPSKFIKTLMKTYNMPIIHQNSICQIKTYKGLNKAAYEPKAYIPFSEEDLCIIKQHLDLQIESLAGYTYTDAGIQRVA